MQRPRRGELEPQCLYGWWEDQLLAERGHRGGRRADALRLSQGEAAVDALLQAVDPAHMNWLAALQFGFIELDCALLRSALRAVLSYLRTTNRQRITVIASGHSASVALGLAAEWSGLWQELVPVAPTWRGPLPTMTGWPSRRFGWLRHLVAAPWIGPALYRLNTSRMVLRLMLRPHVWVDPALLTPARIREQQRLARRPGARFASVAFVSGGLDPENDRAWWLQQARLLQCPLQVVLASEAPPRSRTEMEALAFEAADQISVIPGRLGLHQDCGALLARQLLKSDEGPLIQIQELT